MSRNNSWWNFSHSFDDNNNSKIKKINNKKDEDLLNNNISHSNKEQELSDSETSTNIPDNVSTVTTLVEISTLDNDNNSPTSNAIPIPNQSSQDELKNKHSSSFRSWWSSSTSSLTSFNQKDAVIHNNNNSMEEKQKTTNLTRHDKQFLRHDNGSSISVLTPINEDGSNERQRRLRENELRKSKSSSSSTSLNKLGAESSTDKYSTLVGKTSDSKLSSSYSSNASTTSSSRAWWMFGVGNNNASRDDVSSSNTPNNTTKPEMASKQTQMKEVNTTTKLTDRSFNKDPETTNHISSSNSDSGISSSNGSRKVTKKSSSEIRRWTIFGTWSSSASNLLESTGDGENSKTAGDGDASKLQSHSPPSSINSSKPEPYSNNDTVKNGSMKRDSQSNDSFHDPKMNNNKPQRSRRRPSNPIVETLPGNSSSWKHFFTNISHSQSNSTRIDKPTDGKMITDGSASYSASHSAEKKELSVKNSKNALKISTTVEVEKKASGDASVSASPTLKPVPASVVLPTFEEFARNKPRRNPNSIVQQALHAVNSYFFPPDKSLEGTLPKWLDEITRSSLDVKRIAIIGVHGWFPVTARLVRAVVGEPTGTSPKFCDMMAKAILGYLSKHGIILPSNAITCIPLEGEGTISTREELLHKNLLHNKTWCEALSMADVVFVATHSQGTPVSTILLSRLIKEKLVHPKRQRICMLAMAGISHGPFPYLKESYLVKYYVGVGRGHDADAARELFEFMDSDSLVCKKYRESLNAIIQCGVKIVYVASMDDQVVPLYSGLYTGVDHPSIMRAVYIDGPLYQANDFLTNLIVFATRLRNLGRLDHGLMVQLSKVVAGSMYGEGHSALYTEIDVYTLAVRYLFEMPSLGSSDLHFERFVAQQKNNPYYLPWAMRGVLEDKGVLESRHFTHEILKLRKQYEDWEPVSKAMKDVKFQLEPLRDAILSLKSKL